MERSIQKKRSGLAANPNEIKKGPGPINNAGGGGTGCDVVVTLVLSHPRSDVGHGFFNLVHQDQAQFAVLELIHGGVDGQELSVNFG